MPYNVDEEIEMLAGHIKRLGREEGGGVQVTFKVMSWTLLTGDINHIIIGNINFHSHTLSMHLFVVRGQPRMQLVLSPRKCIALSWNVLLDNIISGAVWRWPGGQHAGVAGGDPQGRQEEGRGELRARAAAAGDFSFMEFHAS